MSTNLTPVEYALEQIALGMTEVEDRRATGKYRYDYYVNSDSLRGEITEYTQTLKVYKRNNGRYDVEITLTTLTPPNGACVRCWSMITSANKNELLRVLQRAQAEADHYMKVTGPKKNDYYTRTTRRTASR